MNAPEKPLTKHENELLDQIIDTDIRFSIEEKHRFDEPPTITEGLGE